MCPEERVPPSEGERVKIFCEEIITGWRLWQSYQVEYINADFTHPPPFDAPARGNPLEFLDETYPTKTRRVRLPYGENFIILTSTVPVWYTL